MLKNIPPIIAPELMKTLMEMGHGDDIVLADGNFPAASVAHRLVRCDGHGIPELLRAILRFFPLDTYVDQPVSLMAVVAGDSAEPTIWNEYQSILRKCGAQFADVELIERFAFYERAKRAYAIVATSEKALYANIILKKGVVSENGPAGNG
jgi:L-fucose mutarotase